MSDTDSEPQIAVSADKERNRYEITVDGAPAGFTAYVDHGGQRIFHHTEIGEQFSGRGLASRLIAAALTDTRSQGLRVVPVCTFVAAYVTKHHDFDEILDPVTPQVSELLAEELG